MSGREKWLLLFILALAPMALGLSTFALSFQRAERVTFCASCHTMTPWIGDLKDPKSKSLAALHYHNRWILKDQCYTCHSDYDFMGPVKAKMDGVRHVILDNRFLPRAASPEEARDETEGRADLWL